MNKSINNPNQNESKGTERIKINNLTKSIKLKNKKNIDKKKIIIISIGAIILIILTILILLLLKPWEKNKHIIEVNNNTLKVEYEDYKNEFFFKTNINDLKRIYISQKLYENMLIDGVQTKIDLIRNTNYDIFIMSEKEADNENKKFYNKTYTGAILVVNYCMNLENENCELKQLIDLTNNTNGQNLRNLEELNNLKDIPIPLCLFTLTDNNILLSIKCPETLPESKKNEIISDLYYFRPTPLKSSETVEKINVFIQNNTNGIILKKNKTGICNIKNNNVSICNTEMSIIKDNEGNLLSHNEIILTNIETNSKNGFKNNKTTKLKDETSKIKSVNPLKYKSILEDLLNELNPYMRYEKLISLNEFNNKIKENNKNEKIRILEKNNNYSFREESLFYKEIFGIKISLNLKDISGINTETMNVCLF